MSSHEADEHNTRRISFDMQSPNQVITSTGAMPSGMINHLCKQHYTSISYARTVGASSLQQQLSNHSVLVPRSLYPSRMRRHYRHAESPVRASATLAKRAKAWQSLRGKKAHVVPNIFRRLLKINRPRSGRSSLIIIKRRRFCLQIISARSINFPICGSRCRRRHSTSAADPALCFHLHFCCSSKSSTILRGMKLFSST
jgi:hypothetical protein